jgi:hypothetical protein
MDSNRARFSLTPHPGRPSWPRRRPRRNRRRRRHAAHQCTARPEVRLKHTAVAVEHTDLRWRKGLRPIGIRSGADDARERHQRPTIGHPQTRPEAAKATGTEGSSALTRGVLRPPHRHLWPPTGPSRPRSRPVCLPTPLSRMRPNPRAPPARTRQLSEAVELALDAVQNAGGGVLNRSDPSRAEHRNADDVAHAARADPGRPAARVQASDLPGAMCLGGVQSQRR